MPTCPKCGTRHSRNARHCKPCSQGRRRGSEPQGWGPEHWDDEEDDEDEELRADGGVYVWAGPGDDGTPPDVRAFREGNDD